MHIQGGTEGGKAILKNVPAAQQSDKVRRKQQNPSLMLKHTCRPNISHTIDQQL